MVLCTNMNFNLVFMNSSVSLGEGWVPSFKVFQHEIYCWAFKILCNY